MQITTRLRKVFFLILFFGLGIGAFPYFLSLHADTKEIQRLIESDFFKFESSLGFPSIKLVSSPQYPDRVAFVKGRESFLFSLPSGRALEGAAQQSSNEDPYVAVTVDSRGKIAGIRKKYDRYDYYVEFSDGSRCNGVPGNPRWIGYREGDGYYYHDSTEGLYRLVRETCSFHKLDFKSYDPTIQFSGMSPYLFFHENNQLFVYDLKTNQLHLNLGDTGCSHYDWSADGKRVACGHNTNITIWDLETGKVLQTLTGFTSLRGIFFHPDNRTLSVLDIYRKEDGHNYWTHFIHLDLENQREQVEEDVLEGNGPQQVWVSPNHHFMGLHVGGGIRIYQSKRLSALFEGLNHMESALDQLLQEASSCRESYSVLKHLIQRKAQKTDKPQSARYEPDLETARLFALLLLEPLLQAEGRSESVLESFSVMKQTELELLQVHKLSELLPRPFLIEASLKLYRHALTQLVEWQTEEKPLLQELLSLLPPDRSLLTYRAGLEVVEVLQKQIQDPRLQKLFQKIQEEVNQEQAHSKSIVDLIDLLSDYVFAY